MENLKDKLPKGSKIIFLGVSGSTSYGLDTEKSDIDYKGIYLQSYEDILSNKYIPQVEVNRDFVVYELRRFLELVLKANPNCLELLYLNPEHELVVSQEFEDLKANRDRFLSKLSFETYAKYANSQLKKATSTNKKYNWDETHKTRKGIIDFATIFCNETKEELRLTEWLYNNEFDSSLIGLSKMKARDSYKLYIDEIKFADLNHRFEQKVETRNYKGFGEGNEPLTSEIEKYMKHQVKGIVYWNREAYSEHCKKYGEYQKWLKNRNEDRVSTNKSHGQKFDSKNISHLYRLLLVAEDIVKKGTVVVDQTANRDKLLSIRNGKEDLKDIINECEGRMKSLEGLFKSSNLPEQVEDSFIHDLEIKYRKNEILRNN